MITGASAELLDRDFGLLSEVIARHARERSEKPALIQDDDILSYQALDAGMNRIAAALQRAGASPGDNIAIVSETTLSCALVFLGALRAGCTPTPLPPSATPAQLGAMIADCRAALVFADRESALALDGAAARLVRSDRLEDWLGSGATGPEPVVRGPDDPFNII